MLIGYAIPGFVLGVLLIVLFAGGTFFDWFPLRGLTSDNWADAVWPARIADYFWHLTLPLTCLAIGSFAIVTMLTKNTFVEEMRKQYVLVARAKGLSREARALQAHLPQRADPARSPAFPAAFVGAFFAGSVLIETLFSLDGLGLLCVRIGGPARLSGRARLAVPVHADRPGRQAGRRPAVRRRRSARAVRERWRK